MKTEIYTLDRDDLGLLEGDVPEYVISRASDPGYFTLGAAGRDEEDGILGIAQFYINITSEGECFAELIYVFVYEEYRRQGIGTKLVERISKILKKSDIKTSTFLVTDPIDKKLGYLINMNDLGKFFGECSYVKAKDDRDVWITTLGEVLPDLAKKNVVRFVRLIDR